MEVFNERVEDVFKGTIAADSFLYIVVIDTDGKVGVEGLTGYE